MKGTCGAGGGGDSPHQMNPGCIGWTPTMMGDTQMEAAAKRKYDQYEYDQTAGLSRRQVLERLRDFGESWADHEYAVAELKKLEQKPLLGVTDLAAQFRRDLNAQGEKVKSLLKEKLENPVRAELDRLRDRRRRDSDIYTRDTGALRRQVEELQTEVGDLRQYTGLQSGTKEPIAPAFPFGSTALKQALQFAAETIAPRSTNAKFLMLFASTWSEQVQYDGKPFSLYGLYWWALLNLADALSSPSVVPEHKRPVASMYGETLRQWGNFMKARTRWELSLGPARFLPGVNQSI